MAVTSTAQACPELLLRDSFIWSYPFFSHHKAALVCEHVICWELSPAAARGFHAPPAYKQEGGPGNLGLP